MNWYKIAIKQEALKDVPIWETEQHEEPFTNALNAMYELEYKKHMLQTHGFNGMPQRQENMLAQIDRKLLDNTAYVRKILLQVLANWLKNHALLSPKTWAAGRMQSNSDPDDIMADDPFGNMLGEYVRYMEPNFYSKYNDSTRNQKENVIFNTMINQAFNNKKFPVFNNILQEYFLPDYKMMLQDELSSDGFEEFNQRYNNKFKTEEDAEQFIDNISIKDVDLESLTYFEDIKTFGEIMERTGKSKEILQEFYQNAVFPVWFGHWKDQGIEDTREVVENIYKDLKAAKPKDLGNLIATTNAALNASHQTGEMIDYVSELTGENDLYETLESLSRGDKVKEWDQELMRVGVMF